MGLPKFFSTDYRFSELPLITNHYPTVFFVVLLRISAILVFFLPAIFASFALPKYKFISLICTLIGLRYACELLINFQNDHFLKKDELDQFFMNRLT